MSSSPKKSGSLPPLIIQTLNKLREHHILRSLKPLSAQNIDFTSNDYLGIRKQFNTANLNIRFGGSGGSRLLEGNHPEHLALEAYCAEWFRGDSALLYNSGYDANVGVLSAIGGRHDTFLYDERCHASLKDGIRLSLAEKKTFKSTEDLRKKISESQGTVFIVTEALFSMDGDWCPLADIAEIAKTTGAYIILDESHSTGITGPEGSGLCCNLGLEDSVLIRIHTFGKACGASGAVVIAAAEIRDFLINTSRTFIYTTAMPPFLAGFILECCTQTRAAEKEREKLLKNIQLWSELSEVKTESPIIPRIIPGNETCRNFAETLQAKGFNIRAILSPTVARGSERLRIILHSYNTREEIRNLWQHIYTHSS